MKTILLSLLLVALSAGCGSDSKPVSYSQPVDITLPAIQSKSFTSGGAISTDKDISTAGSNPYGAFVAAAVQHLGGKNPSRIAVTSLSLAMATTPAGLTFDQIFTGTVTVGFSMNGSGNAYTVGSITGPTGTAPVGLTAAFDSGSMPPADYTALLQGQFKVVLGGTATSGASGFNGTNTATESANIDATFGFVAYE